MHLKWQILDVSVWGDFLTTFYDLDHKPEKGKWPIDRFLPFWREKFGANLNLNFILEQLLCYEIKHNYQVLANQNYFKEEESTLLQRNYMKLTPVSKIWNKVFFIFFCPATKLKLKRQNPNPVTWDSTPPPFIMCSIWLNFHEILLAISTYGDISIWIFLLG